MTVVIHFDVFGLFAFAIRSGIVKSEKYSNPRKIQN